MAKTLVSPGGVAVVRTVAPGFKPGVPKCRSSVSALKRAKERSARKPSLSPAQAGSQNRDRRAYPRLEAVGYGSHAGFADGRLLIELNRRRRTFRGVSGGEAAIRTVAPGFEPGDSKRSPNFVSALKRAKERFARSVANRSAAGPAAGPPAARWRVANSNLPPIRRRSSRRAAGATAGA
jgi:hypothetical protein